MHNAHAPMLRVTELHGYYGQSHVLRGVDFTLAPGEIVALLGRNGSGRTSTARAVMGMLECSGHVFWRPTPEIPDTPEVDLLGQKTHHIARHGIGYVPEHRDIFPRLTVHQNLMLGQQTQRPRSSDGNATAHQRPPWGFEDAYALFPRLHERRHMPAGVLSGGEQQMLCLCRTMMGQPRLVLIDEPTEGLAPMLVQQVAQFLSTLRTRGVGVLLIEQKLSMALDIADRCLVMGQGRIVFEGRGQDLRHNSTVRQQWLQV